MTFSFLNLKSFTFSIALIYALAYTIPIYAQEFAVNGGVLAKAEITLGNQNQWLKLGVFGFGTLNYGDAAIESGVSFASYSFLKRHTVNQKGVAYGYEVYALGGIGGNSNLLGSSISDFNTSLLINLEGRGGFQGVGAGFGKDYLPGKLKPYGLRRGQFIVRSSIANHNIHIVFHNDVHLGNIFNGQGTDYGSTGALTIGFTEISGVDEVYQLGIGVDLFTARPNYSQSPRNPINSDDGRKNVWFTLPPYKDLFYGNLFVYGTYQNEFYTLSGKLGINSQKSGAFIQNTLHDGFGLNPRFPWDVTQTDRLFIELSGSLFIDGIGDE